LFLWHEREKKDEVERGGGEKNPLLLPGREVFVLAGWSATTRRVREWKRWGEGGPSIRRRKGGPLPKGKKILPSMTKRGVALHFFFFATRKLGKEDLLHPRRKKEKAVYLLFDRKDQNQCKREKGLPSRKKGGPSAPSPFGKWEGGEEKEGGERPTLFVVNVQSLKG